MPSSSKIFDTYAAAADMHSIFKHIFSTGRLTNEEKRSLHLKTPVCNVSKLGENSFLLSSGLHFYIKQ
jgi:hypothetical protein